MSLSWYKRDPHKALTGMMILTLEQRGAYNTILDLIYSHNGALLDNSEFICGWLRCDIRVWRRLKSDLINLEKIYIENGFIKNKTADVVILRANSRPNRSTQVQRTSTPKSDPVSFKNNDLFKNNDEKSPGELRTKNSERESISLTTESESYSLVGDKQKKPKSEKAACRIEVWMEREKILDIPQEWGDWSHATLKMSVAEINNEWEKFLDYWKASGAATARKKDWFATWRTWCRNFIQYKTQKLQR